MADIVFGNNVDAQGFNIKNAADGVDAGDLVTKRQLDYAILLATMAFKGTAVKNPVRAVATTPITLSGLQTISGVALSAYDRVLVNGQADPIQNGFFDVAFGAWSRSFDAAAGDILSSGTIVVATESEEKLWKITATSIIGTSAQNWEPLLGS
ncbi:hypothetical protein BKG87_22040 [Mycobacteroides chelonae]|nr:hypothetical protein BKG87_22040 [Mycobacteroides chelonae]